VIKKNKRILVFSIFLVLLIGSFGLVASESDGTDNKPMNSQTSDGSNTHRGILDSVTYNVTNIDRSDTIIQSNITYKFSKEVIEATIKVDDPYGTEGKIIFRNSTINDGTLNVSNPRHQISFQYRFNVTDVGVRSVLYSHTFMNWWETDGEIRTRTRNYNLDYEVTDEYVSVEHTEPLGDGFMGHLHTNASIAYTDEMFYISDYFEPDTYILDSKENRDVRIHDVTNEKANVSGIAKRFSLIQRSQIQGVSSNGTVDIFIHPRDSYRYTGGSISRNSPHVSLWVSDSTVDNQYSTTVTHEIIHSIQKHYTSDNMEWWIEGSAQYIGGLAEYESQGYQNEKYIRDSVLESNWEDSRSATVEGGESLKLKFQNNTLSDPETWNGDVDYRRGARISYLIDVRLRSSSNADILTVFNWMNNQNEEIDYKHFRSKIVNLTDEDFASRLDRYVFKSETIDVQEEASEILGRDFTPRLPQYTFTNSIDYRLYHCSETRNKLCISTSP
jgi:hypothetical protein